jgi:hypothetical protein
MIDWSIDRSIVRLRRVQISKKGRFCIGFALGAAFATRQSFSRLSQTDRLIVRLIIFKFCRFSNTPFLNLGATDFRSEWRARAPRRKLSEECFSEPRLPASHPDCQNSISALFCLQVYHLQLLAKCEGWQYSCTLDFKSHFKLVVFLGSEQALPMIS